MKAIVSRKELQAALLFTSSDESRYVLQGVNIEMREGQKPTIVATDGRRLVVIQTVAEQSEECECNHEMLLRGDFIKAVCDLSKAIGGKLFPWIEIVNCAGSKRVQVSFVGGKAILDAEDNALVEGAFPAWRQVLPAKKAIRQPMNDVGLNAEFIGDFAKAAKLLEAKSGIVQMNLIGEDKGIEIKINQLENFYGLVMPCKIDEEVDYQPEFVSITNNLPKDTEEGIERDDVTVTISTEDGETVKMTGRQFKKSADKLSKK